MSTIADEILDMLKDDMVRHGLLEKNVEQNDLTNTETQLRVRDLLAELLATAKVEIGIAKLARPDYVEFVAWNGSVEERVQRAQDAVCAASRPDKEFAYWLCLRENVDRFENEPSVNSNREE